MGRAPGDLRRLLARGVKRAFDVVFGVAAGAALILPFAAIALAVKLDSRGPAFFLQERVGQRGRPFRIFKFRTMVQDAAKRGLGQTVSHDDERITRVGRWLRNWGLDELPQVINVLRGEMSVVGPRPTLAYQVAQYTPEQRRRLNVKPGITGLAVVEGRNRLSWAERIARDVWYVEHWSVGLDARILIRTLWVILVTREGVYGADGVNDDFSGNR